MTILIPVFASICIFFSRDDAKFSNLQKGPFFGVSGLFSGQFTLLRKIFTHKA